LGGGTLRAAKRFERLVCVDARKRAGANAPMTGRYLWVGRCLLLGRPLAVPRRVGVQDLWEGARRGGSTRWGRGGRPAGLNASQSTRTAPPTGCAQLPKRWAAVGHRREPCSSSSVPRRCASRNHTHDDGAVRAGAELCTCCPSGAWRGALLLPLLLFSFILAALLARSFPSRPSWQHLTGASGLLSERERAPTALGKPSKAGVAGAGGVAFAFAFACRRGFVPDRVRWLLVRVAVCVEDARVGLVMPTAARQGT